MIKVIFLKDDFLNQFLKSFPDTTSKFNREIIEEVFFKGIIKSRKEKFSFEFFIIPILKLGDIESIYKQLEIKFDPYSIVIVGKNENISGKRYSFHSNFGWMYLLKKNEVFERSNINQFVTTFFINYEKELKNGQLKNVKRE